MLRPWPGPSLAQALLFTDSMIAAEQPPTLPRPSPSQRRLRPAGCGQPGRAPAGRARRAACLSWACGAPYGHWISRSPTINELRICRGPQPGPANRWTTWTIGPPAIITHSGVSEVVQKGAKRFVRITILAGYTLCSCPLGRLGGHWDIIFKTIIDSGPHSAIDEELLFIES